MAADAESKIFEGRREYLAMLKTVTAPPAIDQLSLDGLRADSWMVSQQHVDVCKSQRVDMGPMEPLEETETRGAGSTLSAAK